MLDSFLSVVKPLCRTEPVIDDTASPKAIKIAAMDLVLAMDTLYRNPTTYFDMLSCITGIDNGVQAAAMEVVYNLYSIPFNHHLMVKVTLPRDQAAVDSVSHIWRTAGYAAFPGGKSAVDLCSLLQLQLARPGVHRGVKSLLA